MSAETSKDNRLWILMSGEPQGGVKMRRHDPQAHYRYDRHIEIHTGAQKLRATV